MFRFNDKSKLTDIGFFNVLYDNDFVCVYNFWCDFICLKDSMLSCRYFQIDTS